MKENFNAALIRAIRETAPSGENLANALKLQALLNRIAPGLCRDIDLRTERFNQHETPGSLLVEFGCTGNTLAEALRSADYLGQALCEFWDMIEFSEKS